MAIPKAPLGEEYGYDFQYAVFVKDPEGVSLFLDSFLYEPAFEPAVICGEVWLAAEDLRRIYAPYLEVRRQGQDVLLLYRHPLEKEATETLQTDEICLLEGRPYIKVIGAMSRCFGKEAWEQERFAVVAVDGKKPVSQMFPSPLAFQAYRNRLCGKDRGEQDYSVWMEEANRVIPYRMYLPFDYRPGVPHKAVVCFHGGDANADYVFRHTNNEICLYAEKYGYVLLALCSYRKFTFFGASKIPAGREEADPLDPNPCGLTDEQMEHCNVAEASVLRQIEDANRHCALDRAHLYAMGNSGGSLGIFRQIQVLPDGYFRRAVCSGGIPAVRFLDTEVLKAKGTRILLLMATEDVFDGQYTYRVGYPYLKEHGVAVDFHPVGGGSHLLGWTRALDVIFDYLEDDYSK